MDRNIKVLCNGGLIMLLIIVVTAGLLETVNILGNLRNRDIATIQFNEDGTRVEVVLKETETDLINEQNAALYEAIQKKPSRRFKCPCNRCRKDSKGRPSAKAFIPLWDEKNKRFTE